MQNKDGLYPYFIDPTTGLKDFWATSGLTDSSVKYCLVNYLNGRMCNCRNYWEIEKEFTSKEDADRQVLKDGAWAKKCIVEILWGTGYEKSDAYDNMKRLGHFR